MATIKSIEEKARAYDIALDKIKRLLGSGSNCSREELEYVFPELEKSDDEKIRKELIGFLRNIPNSNYTCEEMALWLEKQGKNNMGISEATKQKLEDNLNKALEKETPESWNKFLEKQGEQKPVDKVEPKFKVGDEIKTANEESLTITKIDEKGYWSEDLFICGFDDAAKWELVEQKPAWSEEDEVMLGKCIDAASGYYSPEYKQSMKDWLYSLKDRYTWKPSDKQMETLKYACGGNYVDLEVLESLYNDLKKLKG